MSQQQHDAEPSQAHFTMQAPAHHQHHLPPLQHFEPQQHHHRSMPPYPPHGPQMQHPPPPPPPPPAAFPSAQYPPPYQNGGAMPAAPPMPSPANSGSQPNGQQMMRYPLPPQNPMDAARQMSGGRHKKEIKRRTKTGCLTCRKRRIKCDEGHPTCRNCEKSKRECLGYDPIFKQQPGPANIQPAPAGGNPPPSHSSGTPSLPYNSPPTSYSGPGGAFTPNPNAHPGEQRYGEYSTSLDPALGGGNQLHMARNGYPSAIQPHRKVKPVTMDELFALDDVPPRYNLREAPPNPSAEAQSQIEQFYRHHYATGLDRLFETTWYSTRGLAHLQREPALQDFALQVAEQMRGRTADESSGKLIRSLEARLIWSLADMPRSLASNANGAANDPLVLELLPRIDTVESLLIGQFLDPSKVPAPPQQPSPHQAGQDATAVNQKFNELQFWHHVARFVSLRDDNPAALKDVSDALAGVRGVLNMLENRDVLYSVAIARHIGGRMEGFHPQRHLVTSTNDPNDDVNKLKIAHQFVEGEDQRGTTQVIQRVCSMAIRGWILQKQ